MNIKLTHFEREKLLSHTNQLLHVIYQFHTRDFCISGKTYENAFIN